MSSPSYLSQSFERCASLAHLQVKEVWAVPKFWTPCEIWKCLQKDWMSDSPELVLEMQSRLKVSWAVMYTFSIWKKQDDIVWEPCMKWSSPTKWSFVILPLTFFVPQPNCGDLNKLSTLSHPSWRSSNSGVVNKSQTSTDEPKFRKPTCLLWNLQKWN